MAGPTDPIPPPPSEPDEPRLEVVLRDDRHVRPGPEREVAVVVRQASATAGDLAAAVGWDGLDVVLVDGVVVPLGCPLRATPVRRGSVVVARRPLGPDGDAASGRRPAVGLRLVSGPDAGRVVALAPGHHVLGRGAGVDVAIADVRLARRHALVEVARDGRVTVTDLAPSQPTRVDGRPVVGSVVVPPRARLEAGATELEVVVPPVEVEPAPRSAPAEARPLGAGWTEPFHRPPRGPARPPLPTVRLPSGPAVSGPTPLGVAAVVATLLAAVVMALIVHQPAFVLLAVVGAVSTLTTAGWQRYRDRATRRSARRTQKAQHARFAVDLAAQRAAMAEYLRVDALELADAVAVAASRTSRLWERRSGDGDAFVAVIGRGPRIVPPALSGDESGVPAELWAQVEAASTLADVPMPIDVGPGQVVGVAGPPDLARALVRSLVIQLATAHGPADLLVGCVSSVPSLSPTPDPADWLCWLPHSVDPTSGDSLVLDRDTGALLGRLGPPSGADGGAHLVVVVDDPSALMARNAPLRRLLAAGPRSTAALIVAVDAAELPNVCTTIVSIDADGWADVRRPAAVELAERAAVAGASRGTARSVGLALARLSDPEQASAVTALPADVRLASLLGPRLFSAADLAAAWATAGDDPRPCTLLAAAADGPVEIDLSRDGPHALIAGTTGAGKSELLRSLVAGLAAGTGPEQLGFVLIDYKGGSAFDACARLPHVAGLVTDLDERLAERAIRSLRTELRRREQMLRDAGAADLTAYRALPGRPTLARLVVVVDEFATLAADLPDFVSSLVGVAQRGRSLGVHLVLATQRPAGAVSDDIRANTNLRIALRVQDATDSRDVIGESDAALLPRHRPGRALIRFGPGETVPVQVASITAPRPMSGPPLTLEPMVGDLVPLIDESAACSDLVAFVAAAIEAAALGGHRSASAPWAPPLPEHLALDTLPAGAVGLLDEPDRQSQSPWSWDVGAGHLLCIGTVGAGVHTALTSIALAASAVHRPDELHVYVVARSSSLIALGDLPHVGAVIGPAELERQARLIRVLSDALHERVRLAATGARPTTTLVVVEQLASWRGAVAERLGPDLADALDRLLVEGPSVGIVVAGGLDRPGALPMAVSGAVGERLLFRLAEPGDAAVLGVRGALVTQAPPGRAVLVSRHLAVQIGRASDVAAAVDRIARGHDGAEGVAGRAPTVRCLPTFVDVADLAVRSCGTASPWALPIGISDATLAPAELVLHPGDHALVTGPARSGKSTALALVAHQLRAVAPSTRLVAVVPRRSPLASADVDDVRPDASALDLEGLDGKGVVVLIDDAELVDDHDHRLAMIAGGSVPGVHLVAASRIEALRAAYGHWTQAVRRQRRGLVLAPQGDADGDVLSVLLPRRSAAPPAPGRGYLVVDGGCQLVQLASVRPRCPNGPAASLVAMATKLSDPVSRRVPDLQRAVRAVRPGA
jgi:S-DNA-T family DNA segregation ATPase FtsK/SpoIIIE